MPPGQLGHRAGAGRSLAGLRARGGAVDHPARDALQDRADAEQVVGEVVVPVGQQRLDRVDRHARAGARQVAPHVVALGRNAQRGQVAATDAAEGARRDVPGHRVVAEVGDRVAERRQLPVQHRQHPRLGRMEDQVVEPVVAMHHRDLRVVARGRGQVRRQPVDQPVHLGNRLGDRGLVLTAPARDLALEVAARAAVVAQADRQRIDPVQRGDHPVHLVVDRAALGRRHARQRLVPQHPALDMLHQVEGAADHRLVLAQQQHARHRHLGGGQRAHHPVLALDRVRRGQQLRRRSRLGAHHPLPGGRAQPEGRVGLAAAELLDLQRAVEAVEPLAQPGGERVGIEGMLRGHRAGGRGGRGHRRHLLAGAESGAFGVQRSAIAISFSRESTTSRVGSTRTAPSRSKPLSSWLTRWREAPTSCARSSCASCRPMRISSP